MNTNELAAFRTLLQAQQTTIKCVECGVNFNYGAERLVHGDGLYEFGIRCPLCDAWYHAYFITDEIIKLPRRNRNELRHYRAELKRLNKRERKLRGLRKVNGRWLDAGRVQDTGSKAKTPTG
jgi:hypothetical protein